MEPGANTGAFHSVCRGPPAGGTEYEAPGRVGVGLCPDVWDPAAQGRYHSLHAGAPSSFDPLLEACHGHCPVPAPTLS